MTCSKRFRWKKSCKQIPVCFIMHVDLRKKKKMGIGSHETNRLKNNKVRSLKRQ